VTVVVGTAGHIDHGKTTLLRALTGIDADRLPEEQRRGMTIDVGYAHLALPDGRTLDFVDVPGHDRLDGNMLVGAGEIDAALVVVAADDGPRAQTLEHVELIDALGIGHGLAVVTKAGLVDEDRLAEVVSQVERLLGRTSLSGSPTIAADSLDGSGLDAVREALLALDRSVRAAGAGGGDANGGGAQDRPRFTRLAIDRVFAVKGRGAVATGTLRDGRLARGSTLRLVPGDRSVRVREIQVRPAVDRRPGTDDASLAGVDATDLHRGLVVTDGRPSSRRIASWSASPARGPIAPGPASTSAPPRSMERWAGAAATRSSCRMGPQPGSSGSSCRSRSRRATASSFAVPRVPSGSSVARSST
jgi:selenocysteine-specific elongation factor